jgi:hypothetical protein
MLVAVLVHLVAALRQAVSAAAVALRLMQGQERPDQID